MVMDIEEKGRKSVFSRLKKIVTLYSILLSISLSVGLILLYAGLRGIKYALKFGVEIEYTLEFFTTLHFWPIWTGIAIICLSFAVYLKK
jgi:hypothetical protein